MAKKKPPAPIPDIGCLLMALPPDQILVAAATATEISPVNAPFEPQAVMAAYGVSEVLQPQAIAMLTTRYWGPRPRTLGVSFLDGSTVTLRNKLLSHMNAWYESGCIRFGWSRRDGEVRITRDGAGYWSYLGTDVTLIPANQPTMNLQGFTTQTPESEYRRVVRHEVGHTLGFPHEHMRQEIVARIDRPRAYAYYQQNQGWPRQVVDAQVLTPLDPNAITAGPVESTSIMTYQMPGSIMKDRVPVPGGSDITRLDHDFNRRVYPKPVDRNFA